MSRRDPDDLRDPDDDEDSTWLPTAGGLTAWPAGIYASGADDEYEEYEPGTAAAGDEYGTDADAGDGGWLDEGLVTLLVVAGAALVLFPEPATSGLGIFLLGLGVLVWIYDLLTPTT